MARITLFILLGLLSYATARVRQAGGAGGAGGAGSSLGSSGNAGQGGSGMSGGTSGGQGTGGAGSGGSGMGQVPDQGSGQGPQESGNVLQQAIGQGIPPGQQGTVLDETGMPVPSGGVQQGGQEGRLPSLISQGSSGQQGSNGQQGQFEQQGNQQQSGQQQGRPQGQSGQQGQLGQQGRPQAQAGQQSQSGQQGQQQGRPQGQSGQQGGQPGQFVQQGSQQGQFGQQGSQPGQKPQQSGQQQGRPQGQAGQQGSQPGEKPQKPQQSGQQQPGQQQPGQQPGFQTQIGQQGVFVLQGQNGQQGSQPGQQGSQPGQQGSQPGQQGQQGQQGGPAPAAGSEEFDIDQISVGASQGIVAAFNTFPAPTPGHQGVPSDFVDALDAGVPMQNLGVVVQTEQVPFVPVQAPAQQQQAPRPNILFFVMDDLGHADISYQEGNKQTPTPNIDKIAYDGIILNRHYSTSICTPTRAAFLTGKFINQLGIPHIGLSPGEPWGVPLQFKMMPEYFKNLGYTTVHVGKWHLGEHTREYYPIGRGFDVSYGFTAGDSNFFNYTSGWISPVPLSGRQLRDQGRMVPANHTNNNYLPQLLTDKAIQVIRNSDPTKPWLMYFATPLVHTAIDEYGAAIHTMPAHQLRPAVFKFTDQFPERKKCLAMMQALDQSFKDIIDALVNKGVIENTIVVGFADNNAPIPPGEFFVHGSNHGSNWPLRHGKGSIFEGGIRTLSWIWSPLLQKRGRITNQLFSVTDWLPTIYEAAGGDIKDLQSANLGGMSQWQSLKLGLSYGPRTELPAVIDVRNMVHGPRAMIYQDSFGTLYKYMAGGLFDNSFFGWWRTEGTTAEDNSWRTWTPVSVQCNFPEGQEVNACKPNVEPCLFDLTNDPCETNNIYRSYPAMVKLLEDRIAFWNATSIANQVRPYDPKADPQNWGGLWVPWLDANPLDPEPLTYAPFNPSSSF